MRNEWFRHPPHKRESIRSGDAEHDAHEEIAHYFSRDKEDEAALEVVGAEQRRSVGQLDEEEQRDIEAILTLAREHHLDIGDQLLDAQYVTSAEDAYERLRHSGGNALYPLVRYIEEHDNDASAALSGFISDIFEELADESSLPLLIGLLREERFCSAATNGLEIVIGEMARRESRWLESVSDQLIIVVKDAHARGDTELKMRALQALVLTRSATAREYFASPNAEATREEILNTHDVAPIRRRRLLDGYGKDEAHEEAYERDYFDDYDWDTHDDDYEPQHPVFRGTGLRLEVLPASLHSSWLADHGVEITDDTLVGHIDFTPGGYTHYAGQFRTEFLLAGYEDFKQYFAAADSGDYPHVEFLIGSTNREMARAALILGFSIVDNEEAFGWQVIARPEEVRARLQELEQKRLNGTPLIERMRERVRNAPIRVTRVAA